jgi:hypothetical protein
MDKKKIGAFSRLSWETQIDYNYRVKTGEIIFKVGDILNKIAEIAKKGTNYQGFSEQLIKENHKLMSLSVPEKYSEAQKLLKKMLNCYIFASKLFEKGIKDKDKDILYRTGRYLKEGNSWMEIAKIRIWEIVEKAVNERKKK